MPFRILRLLFLSSLAAGLGSAKIPVILSTDVGNEIDDQWAITYLLTNPDFQVEGIISAHAPSLPDPSAHSSYRILVDVVEHRLGMATHPPLYEGSSLPLSSTTAGQANAGVDFIISTSKQFSRANRLTVVAIGAATDVASAIIEDPGIVDRIRVVAMGFQNLTEAGKEYNVENDPRAWQVILASNVPVTIGCGEVCRRFLSLNYEEAKSLLSGHGPIGVWLWQEYQSWYFAHVKPLRVNDFSQPWVIWDLITLAEEEKMTTQKQMARPKLTDDLRFTTGAPGKSMEWITGVDAKALWASFLQNIDSYQRTHAIAAPAKDH